MKTLVLDLDETLIHADFMEYEKSDIKIPVNITFILFILIPDNNIRKKFFYLCKYQTLLVLFFKRTFEFF